MHLPLISFGRKLVACGYVQKTVSLLTYRNCLSGISGTPRTPTTRLAPRMRPSPSLPLHLPDNLTTDFPRKLPDRSTDSRTSQNSTTQNSACHHTRAKHSAPDLTFLSSNIAPAPTESPRSQQTQKTKLPRPFSCPERFLPQTGPIRINPVEDWESLKLLLPQPLQKLFGSHQTDSPQNWKHSQHSQAAFTAFSKIPTVPWGIHPEEREAKKEQRKSSAGSQDVCRTCFKMQTVNTHLTQSTCDCSPTSSSGGSSSVGINQSVFVSAHDDGSMFVVSVDGCQEDRLCPGKNVFDDLMKFSRQERRDAAPMQLVINLKHKQGTQNSPTDTFFKLQTEGKVML